MNNPIVDQKVLEAFINIYIKNPQIEDKHSAMAEELGIDRELAKRSTYKLILTHTSLRFIQELGTTSELWRISSFMERKNPSSQEISSFLEERVCVADNAYNSFRNGVYYSIEQSALDIKKLKESRADTNI